MRRERLILHVALVATTLAWGSGCVGKKLFRTTVEETDTRVGAVESAVEANERRMADMRDETDSKIAEMDREVEQAVEVGTDAKRTAMEAATLAERAAMGKLLWEVTLSDDSVKFSFGEATVPAEAAQALDELADRIKSYGKAVYVEIQGHTDSAGGEDYNLSLGQRRAEAVRNYLAAEGGIPLHAMNTISFGESQPVADNSTPGGRAKNRRVVVRVLE